MGKYNREKSIESPARCAGKKKGSTGVGNRELRSPVDGDVKKLRNNRAREKKMNENFFPTTNG